MKRFKILAVIAIIALAGCLLMACSSGDSSSGDGDGGSTVNGWQGGKRLPGSSTPSSGGASTIAVISDPSQIIQLMGIILEYDSDNNPVYSISFKNEMFTVIGPIDTKGKNIRFDYPVKFDAGTEITVSPSTTINFNDWIYASDNDLTVKGGGTVLFNSGGYIKNLEAKEEAAVGIYGATTITDSLIVTDGTVTLGARFTKNAEGEDIVVFPNIGELSVAKGTVDIYGETSIGDLTVDDGTVNFNTFTWKDKDNKEQSADPASITGDLSVNGGTVNFNGDADITGKLLVEGGTVNLNSNVDVVDKITIGDADGEGFLTISSSGTLTAEDDVTVLGTLTLNGALNVEDGAIITICEKGIPFKDPNASTATATLDGTGTVYVTGAMVVQANSSNSDEPKTPLDKFPLNSSLVFYTGSSLTFVTKIGWATIPNDEKGVTYNVISNTGGAVGTGSDIVLTSGIITVQNLKPLKLTLSPDEDSTTPAEASIAGWFPLGGAIKVADVAADPFFEMADLNEQGVTIDYDFVVEKNSTLTTAGKYLLIKKGGTLTTTPDTTKPGKIEVSENTWIINRGTILNGGTIEVKRVNTDVGTIVNGGTLTNNGKILNSGDILNQADDGKEGRGSFGGSGTYLDGPDSSTHVGNPATDDWPNDIATVDRS